MIGKKVYSTKFKADGWGTILEYNKDTCKIKFEDGPIAEVEMQYIKESPDSDFNDWMQSEREKRELFPERPM